ncbi:MAG: DUF6504 family protein [Mycobacteriales bacterium]
MSRLHADAVEVHRRDDEPAQFLWRGRLYVVREVLARWTESGGWWRSAAVQALSSGGPAGEVNVGQAAVDDGEQDWFRVEAGAGRAAGTGVYDLCFSWTSGCWSLARVLD